MNRAIAASFCTLFLPSVAWAEVEVSIYAGTLPANAADVAIRSDDSMANTQTAAPWVGHATVTPRTYGIRATRWRSPSFGYGVELSRSSLDLDEGNLPPGYTAFAFANQLNTLTVNAYRRWSSVLGDVSPYVGGGVGLSVPHLEAENHGFETDNYQISGAAATVIAGATYPINDQWSVFGEYKGTYSANSADLDGGDTVETDLITNALNLGLSFSF